MKGEHAFKKRVLFVDDDPVYHEMLSELYLLWGDGSWEMEFASSAYQALSMLQQKPFKLAVIDINMPVLDGMQLLVMIARRHPDIKQAVMTAFATAENRAFCLANGAELFIQKPRSADGMKMVFTMLNDLVSWTPGEGFQGMLRQVGLQDVIQMECLGRNSSILEIHNQQMRGRIYIEDGNIIHAHVGEQTGQSSLQKLLALSGGSFQLLPFEKPPQRTIEGSWEFLLMEAARLHDETASQTPPPEPQARPADEPPPAREIAAAADSRPRVMETLICSGNGEVLYEAQCPDAQARVQIMRQIAQAATSLGQLLPLGTFRQPRSSMAFRMRGHASAPQPHGLCARGPARGAKSPIAIPMNDALNEWLASCALMPGMLGCGVRFPNQICLSYSFNEACSRERLDEMLNSLAGALTRFSAQKPASPLLTWTFTEGLVRLIVRPDGVMLGLASTSDALAAENLKQVTEEFLTLQI